MKKLLSLLAAMALVLTLAGCGEETPVEPVEPTVEAKTTEGKTFSYGGELVLNVTTKGDKLEKIEVVSHKETDPVFNRAFPIIVDRIMTAQSPVVDNVSGATFMSNAVKKIVSEVMDANCGTNFGTNLTPAPVEKKQLENVSTDLVIVGGGPAGIAAALTAKENGVENVIIVEKLDILSGNGKFDQDFNRLYNSKQTHVEGTNMTKEEFIASREGYYDSADRVEAWAEAVWDLDEWLRAQGTELNFIIPGSVNDHMTEFDVYAGNEIQTNMEKALAKTDVEVRTGTKGLDFIFDGDRVVGVKVENKEGFYDINAKATIIATGGFSMNKQLLDKYAPGHEDWQGSNQMGATGDFVPVFEKNNFKLDQMSKLTEFENILMPQRHLTGTSGAKVRVTAEGTPAKKGPEVAYYITDQHGYDCHWRIQKHTSQGYYTKYNTLEELAADKKINLEGLQNTVAEYNKSREAAGKLTLNVDGPFYCANTVSMVHMTKGGVAANGKAQVLTNDNVIVPGLYAAGEVTATDGAYAAAVAFGRIAGEESAKEILAK